MKINTDGSMELTVDEYVFLAKNGGITVTDTWSNQTFDTTFDNGPKPAFAEEEKLYGQQESDREKRQIKQIEDNAAQQLPEGQYDVWKLLWNSRHEYTDGWKKREMADAMGLTPATVASRLTNLHKKGWVENGPGNMWRAKL